MAEHLYGMHDFSPDWARVTQAAGVGAWCVTTHELGANPQGAGSFDFRAMAAFGVTPIARLNYSHHGNGTIPLPAYQDFATTCMAFVRNSPGCSRWIIGNEMNYAVVEAPLLLVPNGNRAPITPTLYAQCYQLCRAAIRALPGHENDEVIIGAPAPWNDQTKYADNPAGDWVQYLADILALIPAGKVDGISLHAYTHGPDTALVTDSATMNPPFDHRHYQFAAYKDFMAAIPQAHRNAPVYITEANQGDKWTDRNTGWIGAAYAEIDAWNRENGDQPILALCLYRWSTDDPWTLQDKAQVLDDWRATLAKGYKVNPRPTVVPVTRDNPAVPQAGEWAMARDFVKMRRSPGYVGKDDTDLIRVLAPGNKVRVGNRIFADNIIWRYAQTEPQGEGITAPVYEGWVAQTSPDGTPLIEPVVDIRMPFNGTYPITQSYGANLEDYAKFGLKGHNGIDYGCPWGTPIMAVADGQVVEALSDPGGFGLYIKIVHAWGESICAHLSRQLVGNGQTVKQGDTIGLSGATGNVHGQTFHTGIDTNNRDGAHLHFGIRVNPYTRGDGWAGYSDPAPYLGVTPLRPRGAPDTEPSVGWINTLLSLKNQATANDIATIITTEAARIGLDPILARAVFEVEAGGVDTIPARMTVRCELHRLYGYMHTRAEEDLFNQYFKYDPITFWQGHMWRKTPDAPWQKFHGNQDAEYEVIELAARLLWREAPLLSTSMGPAQIMGFNHTDVGFDSATAMFDAWRDDFPAQVRGFFKLIDTWNIVGALQGGDYATFARRYNGPGNVAEYSQRLRDAVAKLRGTN